MTAPTARELRDLYEVTVYFQRSRPDGTPADFATYLRHNGVDLDPAAVASTWSTVERHESMRADIAAEMAAEAPARQPAPLDEPEPTDEPAVEAPRVRVDLLDGHGLTPGEREALSAAAVSDGRRPRRVRLVRR